jgi:hypothetical protein
LIIAILIYGCKIDSHRPASVKFVFCFILNLALTDVASFGLMVAAVAKSWEIYNPTFYQVTPSF